MWKRQTDYKAPSPAVELAGNVSGCPNIRKGSDEFNEVFDVAVRMFPDDPTANINAAAIELQRGDLQQAVRYLDKADAQASATLNNRGVLKLLQGDLDSAENYFKQAQAKDSVEAGANLEEVTNKRKDEAIFVK